MESECKDVTTPRYGAKQFVDLFGGINIGLRNVLHFEMACVSFESVFKISLSLFFRSRNFPLADAPDKYTKIACFSLAEVV